MHIIVFLAAAIAFATPGRASAAPCESLASLALSNTTITAAETVAGGTFTPPGAARGEIAELPAFCRVAATLRPSGDSRIRIEVWMPVSSWNGKFMGVGNGGLAGTISYGAMGPVLRRGYAVASTDTGHEGSAADGRWALGHPEKQIDFGYKFFVAEDPDWDFRKFDVDTDLARGQAVDRAVGQLTAIDPDLQPFKNRGGKLIQYHGFGEPEIPSESSIDYYESLVRQFGGPGQVDEFYRLFMVPGMGHCRGGAGATDQFDMLPVLERWVERGEAPERIVASRVTRGVVDRTRPLCPYPQVARWTGSGSTDLAANFRCVAPPGP